MRHKARWPILIIAVLIAGLSASHTLGVNASALAELRATNVFHSEDSAFLDVNLERDARWKWDVFEHSTLRIRGDGRVAGFLLVRQDSKTPQGIYAVAFRVCDKPACSEGWSGWVTRLVVPIGFKWPKKGSTFVIPRGRYRAYVITDGAQVEARFSLMDVKGSARFSPTVPVKASVGMQPAPGSVKNVFTAGSTHELAGKGAAVMGFVERHENGAADFFNDCLYEGVPSLPPEIAYSPACEATGASMGFGFGASVPPFVGSGSSGSYSIQPSMRGGTYSFGGTYFGAQSVRDAAFVSLWVTY
jgi:hypothetical protein